VPNDELKQFVTIENQTISLVESDVLTKNTLQVIGFPTPHYRSISVTMFNIIFKDVKSVLLTPTFVAVGTFIDTLHIKDSKFINSTSIVTLAQYAFFSSMTLENVEYSNISYSIAVSVTLLLNMRMNLINFSFLGSTMNSFSSNPPILINALDFSVLTINGIKVQD